MTSSRHVLHKCSTVNRNDKYSKSRRNILYVNAELQVLKLPAGKYTVREREMMTGSGLVPQEFFHASSALSKSLVIGKCCCCSWCICM